MMMPYELREARQRLGVTQKQLAEALGVTLRTIQRLECGETRIRKRTEIAVAKLLESVEPSDGR